MIIDGAPPQSLADRGLDAASLSPRRLREIEGD